MTMSERERELELTRRPDDLAVSRLARLTLLLAAAPGEPRSKPLDVERIATYDFFADNPLLVFAPGTREYTGVLLAGFDAQTLSYHSASQRFSNRRGRLQHDLAQLLARGLIRAEIDGKHVVYELTGAGEELADSFSSVYAQAYLLSARLITRTLNRLGPRQLRDRTARMLDARSFLVDLELRGVSEI
jgi:DNA-binding transcriptional ArsR family regulator